MLISSTERIELKIFIALIGITAFVMGIFTILWGGLIFGIFMFIFSLLLFYYAYRLCRVEIVGDKLRITRNRLTIETPISNIKKVNYRLLMIKVISEPHIKIILKERSKLGKRITFSPSNLTEDGEFRFNMKIKKLLEYKIEEIKNTKANTGA